MGDHLDTVQRVVPLALFSLAGYLYLFEGGRSAGVWAVWGFLTLLIGRAGSAQPLDDTPVGTGRKLVGALTLVLGVLCFTPMPVVLG